ncbi:MAG: hypothetical protein IKP96_06590 [Elusimicrobiaceae bacterium]|nr:hypothetical protein [Elusimicrobiaceae bacterium]
MKKIFVLLFVLLPLNALAVTKQKVSMVTFFPVPYVAYSRLNVTKEMDVGLGKRMCQMSLGCDQLPEEVSPLTVNAATGMTDGFTLESGAKLTLAGSKKLTYPVPVVPGNGVITLGLGTERFLFRVTQGSLRLEQGSDLNRNLDVDSFNTNNLVVGGNLYLFGKTFPACNTVRNGPEDGHVSWQQVALGQHTYWYLVCGN